MGVKVINGPLLQEPCRWGQGSCGRIPEVRQKTYPCLRSSRVLQAALFTDCPWCQDLVNSTGAGPRAAVNTPLSTPHALGSWARGFKTSPISKWSYCCSDLEVELVPYSPFLPLLLQLPSALPEQACFASWDMSGPQGPSVGDGCSVGGAGARGNCSCCGGCCKTSCGGCGCRAWGTVSPGWKPAELGPTPRGLPSAAVPVFPEAPTAAAGGVLAAQHPRGPSTAS